MHSSFRQTPSPHTQQSNAQNFGPGDPSLQKGSQTPSPQNLGPQQSSGQTKPVSPHSVRQLLSPQAESAHMLSRESAAGVHRSPRTSSSPLPWQSTKQASAATSRVMSLNSPFEHEGRDSAAATMQARNQLPDALFMRLPLVRSARRISDRASYLPEDNVVRRCHSRQPGLPIPTPQ